MPLKCYDLKALRDHLAKQFHLSNEKLRLRKIKQSDSLGTKLGLEFKLLSPDSSHIS